MSDPRCSPQPPTRTRPAVATNDHRFMSCRLAACSVRGNVRFPPIADFHPMMDGWITGGIASTTKADVRPSPIADVRNLVDGALGGAQPMSGFQLFAGIFAIVSIAASALAVWRVATAPGAKYKPLWIVGSLFGFVGFATTLNAPGDLYLQFGIQIPVLLIWRIGGGGILLKTLFPLVAIVALVRFHPPTGRSGE
ncbi:MAG: hypothetical protein E6G92_02180 [Alphaproteobacteria bacterium]|nr:MAG: hypothetical protein E6G92_02180 [Alphaproteobacteria bacterium]